MKKTISVIALSIPTLFFIFLISSCKKDNNNNTTPPPQDVVYHINATLSGANEVPANSTTGSGTVTGTYDSTTRLLTYTATWSGLTGAATAGHFHSPALPGTNANPLVFFLLQNSQTSPNSGTASGSATLSPTQEADLFAGKFYANIHTAANGGGEIRGQVSTSK